MLSKTLEKIQRHNLKTLKEIPVLTLILLHDEECCLVDAEDGRVLKMTRLRGT